MKLIKAVRKVKKADKTFTGTIASKKFGRDVLVEIRGYDDGSRRQDFSIYTDGITSGDQKQAEETLKILKEKVKNLEAAITYAKTVK